MRFGLAALLAVSLLLPTTLPAAAATADPADVPVVVVPVEPAPTETLPGIDLRTGGKTPVLRYSAGAKVLSAGAGAVASLLRLLYNHQRFVDEGTTGTRAHETRRQPSRPANRN